MRFIFRQIFSLLYLLWLLPLTGFSQLGDWEHRTPIQFNNTGQAAFTSGAYLFEFDTQTPIGQSKMVFDGRDIRIADSCGQNILPHWVEGDLNTDSTRIWVRLPALGPGDSLDLFLYHGFPAAPQGASFSHTFPNALISQGNNLALQGLQQYDWFELEAGDTLFMAPNSVLEIRAGRVHLDGIVMGDGGGAPASVALSQDGNGDGPGLTSFNAGAGGGGYGNLGGDGGYDFADTPGAGGNAYGTRIGMDLHVGSSGASSPSRLGGSGGGAIRIQAQAIDVNGAILCRGLSGQQPGSTQGGGGGGGGGILLQSRFLTIQGSLLANGGMGSVGFQSGNDDGGGGAGGRIKLFSEAFENQGTYQVVGGTGGPNGSFAPGQDGGDGTILDTVQAYPAPHTFAGTASPSPLPEDPLLIPSPAPICEGAPVQFELPQGYDSLYFYLNGQLVQDTTLSTYDPGLLTQGDEVVVAAYALGCILRDTLSAMPVPAPPLAVVANDSSPCLGDTVILDAGSNWAQIGWNTGDSTHTLSATSSGFYIATVVDNNGCTAIDTYAVNLGIIPLPTIQTSGLPACAGEPVSLSTTQNYSGYAWSNGATGPGTVVFNTGSYSVTVTGSNGCSNHTTATIQYDTLPSPIIMQVGDTLFAQQGYVNYQWLWNGNALNGATNYFYVPTFNGNYTVKVIGTNNCTNTSSATFVMVGAEEKAERNWRLYPNPGRDRMHLRGEISLSQDLEWSVFHVDGSEMRDLVEAEKGSSGGLILNVSKLAPGVYLLIIRSEGKVEHKKMVILE